MSDKTEKVRPVENRRRTYINSIERARAVIRTPEFMESSALKLQETLDELKIAFKRFEEEHQMLIQWANKEEFDKQDEIYAQIEKNYRQTVVTYKERIITLKPGENTHTYIQTNSVSNENATSSTNTKKSAPENENESESECDTVKMESESHDTSESDSESMVIHENQNFGRLQSQIGAVKRESFSRFGFLETEMSDSGVRSRLNVGERSKVYKRMYCNNCTRNHPMYRCPKFLSLSLSERRERVTDLGVCGNCFTPKLMERRMHRCKAGVCKRCGKRHNSLLCEFSRI